MRVSVTNAQRTLPVNPTRLSRIARCAIRQLRIRTSGTLAITLLDIQRMRQLNRRFCHHDRTTDVLSFRYDGEPIVGEILIDPGQARAYARQHRMAYDEELARYVVHGVLHWLGHDDRTTMQQRKMRVMENKILAQCYR